MKVENLIHINVPSELVWAVTVDVERWPEWTPTVKSIKRIDRGPFREGSNATIKQPGLPEAQWVVTAFEQGKSFSWEARVRGIRMIGTHEVTAIPNGTQSVLRVQAFGVVACFMWPFIRNTIERSLQQENEGLKRRCERRDR
jgi:uncharacterized membrane protein